MSTSDFQNSQVSAGERLRLARVTAQNKAVRGAKAAADALGISRQGLYQYETRGKIPLDVLLRAAEVFAVPIADLTGGQTPPPEPTRHRIGEPVAMYGVARTFQTDAEKISYTIGVLDMANAAKSELSRCLDTAMAALLSPLTAPTPVVAGPTVAELVEKHAAATRTAPAVAAQTPAVAKAKGRR